MGWANDPFGRFDQRFFDDRYGQWTPRVRRVGGGEMIDPQGPHTMPAPSGPMRAGGGHPRQQVPWSATPQAQVGAKAAKGGASFIVGMMKLSARTLFGIVRIFRALIP